MSKEKIIEFLLNVKREYCRFLYEYKYYKKCDECCNCGECEQSLGFPFCCLLSANIISSYLTAHTEYCFKNKYSTDLPHNHCWSECVELEMVIDYTDFQLDLDNDVACKFSKQEVSDEEFEKYLSNSKVVHEFYGVPPYACSRSSSQEIKNWTIHKAKSVDNPWTLEAFMQYVSFACKHLHTNKQVMWYS